MGWAWRALSSSDTRSSFCGEEVSEGRFSTGRGTRLDKPSSSELSFWAAPADNPIKLSNLHRRGQPNDMVLPSVQFNQPRFADFVPQKSEAGGVATHKANSRRRCRSSSCGSRRI